MLPRAKVRRTQCSQPGVSTRSSQTGRVDSKEHLKSLLGVERACKVEGAGTDRREQLEGLRRS